MSAGKQKLVKVDGEYVCTLCGESKPPDAFYFFARGAGRPSPRCKKCSCERARLYRVAEANGEKLSFVKTPEEACACPDCGLPRKRRHFPNAGSRWHCRECNMRKSRIWNRTAGQRRRDIRHQQIAQGSLRKCSQCMRDKPVIDFYASTRFRDGSSPQCKLCVLTERATLGRVRFARNGFNDLKCSANSRGHAVEITLEDYRELMAAEACEYCGGPLPLFGHGIDRADSNLGYIPGNCVPCCYPCNTVKNKHFTYDEMKILGAVIAEINAARGGNQLIPAYSLYGDKA